MPHPENIKFSPDRHRPQFLDSPFGGRKTADQMVQLSIDPSQGLTRIRYGWFSDGNRFDETHFANVEAGIRVETDGVADSEARIRSAYPGQYISQAVAQPGLGLVVDDENVTVENGESSLTHGEIYAGAFVWDDVNDQVDTGIGYVWDTDGWRFFVKSLGEHIGASPVPQSEWGIDTSDGDGHSGLTVSPADGYVFNFPHTWYNEGPISGAFLNPLTNHVQEQVRIAIEGRPSTDTPNVPPQLVVRNDGTADPLGVELGGMQYTTYGAGLDDLQRRKTEVARVTPSNYVATERVLTEDEVIDPIADPGEYLMGVRREQGEESLNMRLSNLRVRPDGGDVLILQWDEYDTDTALTGANFESPTAAVDPDAESKLEVDTAATDFTPTVSAFRGMDHIDGGTGSGVSAEEDAIDLRIPIGSTRILTAVHMGSSLGLNPIKASFEEGY